jgi:hypothetical protein
MADGTTYKAFQVAPLGIPLLNIIGIARITGRPFHTLSLGHV